MTDLLADLEDFFGRLAQAGDRVVVAFSGGPDSTALLWGLTRVAPGLGLELHAAHLDHRLDADSRRRAAAARRLAAELDVPLALEMLDAAAPGADGVEAFARRHRYAFLRRLADRLAARFIAVGHHADDQAETVLLRLLFGSGLEGLGAMHSIRGRLVRPLLRQRREHLERVLAATGLEPVRDPTNFDLATPRNAVRTRLLPFLEAREPGTVERLCRLAQAAQGASARLDRRLAPLLSLRCSPDGPAGGRGAAVDRRAFESLPGPLLTPALSLLHRRAGAPYPASAAARRELLRQVRSGARLGCDCGHGWRWEGDAATLRLIPRASPPGEFAYNLSVPGSVDVPELDLRIRLRRGQVASWMFRGRADVAALAIVDLEKRRVQVRNRRFGDRILPLGSDRRRRLKDLLIDRRVPRHTRDRLPLLVIDDEIAWVPGVTIGERFRLDEDSTVWIAEMEHLRRKR